MMRPKIFLVFFIVLLGMGALVGLRHVDENHDDHDHQHEQEDRQEAPVAGQVKLAPEAVKLAGIQTSPAAVGILADQMLLTGELVFNEDHLARIRTRTPGRVVKIMADFGQAVKPGTTLALIESSELCQASTASRQAVARLNASQKAYDRARQLYEGKAISLAELQERQARLEVEKADLENTRSRLRLLGAAGAVSHHDTQAGSQSSLTAGSDSLFALHSPIAGRIVDRKITPGLVIKEDEELFTVADISTLWCFVQIPEKDLPFIRVGSPAVVTANSITGDQFSGRVDYVGDMVDKDSRTVRARVRVDNAKNQLKAGMFANIGVGTGQHSALSIPETALLNANGDFFVFVEMAPGTYQKHPIKIGSKSGGQVEVLAGLQANEPVVVQGGFILKSELEKGSSRGGGLGGTCGHSH